MMHMQKNWWYLRETKTIKYRVSGEAGKEKEADDRNRK